MANKGEKGKDNTPMTIDGVMNFINSKYKTKVIEIASKAKSLKGVRLKTGIFNLDVKLGGGWLKGRIYEIMGEESTGKTYVCTHTIASAQRTCRLCNTPFTSIEQIVTNIKSGEIVLDNLVTDMDTPIFPYELTNTEIEEELTEEDFATEYRFEGCECGSNEPHVCVFIDAEGTYHPQWTAEQGVINDLLNLVQTEFAEQAIDVIEALTRTGKVDLLIVDSVPALTPSKEIEDSAEDASVGTHARLMNRFMRVIQSALNSLGLDSDNKPIIILVNQLRQKIGVMFGSNETTPGGRGIKFAASARVRMGATKRIKIDSSTGKIAEKGANIIPVAVILSYTVPKNKTFTPFQEGNFELHVETLEQFGYHKGKVNNDEQVIKFAGETEVVHKGGGGYYSVVIEDGSTLKAQGESAFVTLLKEKGIYSRIEKETMAKATRRVGH